MIQSIKSPPETDETWMDRALQFARRAGQRGEVPVGAILVRDGQILASAGNRRESLPSPLGHAELLVLHRAALRLGGWRLLGSTLYVTLEPCLMCAGALVQARISRLVYATSDPKGGAIESLYRVAEDSRLNHQFQVTAGVRADESRQLLQDFFRERRRQKRVD
jgi:tRNA(adenine34) deaminase